ncbi:MAG: hypothetical protein RL068_1058 [Actinomycetota bacterium]|jgi:hypothetical protein
MKLDSLALTELLDRNIFAEDHLLRTAKKFLEPQSLDKTHTSAELLLLRLLRVLRRRSNLHRGWNRTAAIALEIDVLEGFACWVGGKDPLSDEIQRIIEFSDQKEVVIEIARGLLDLREREISALQSKRATRPRPNLMSRILDEIVCENPGISARETLKKIKQMVGLGVISRVSDGSIELDDVSSGKSATVKIDSIRSRLSHAKARLKKNSH